jgi:hypothetical protein
MTALWLMDDTTIKSSICLTINHLRPTNLTSPWKGALDVVTYLEQTTVEIPALVWVSRCGRTTSQQIRRVANDCGSR